MKCGFYNAGGKAIAINFKVASATLARAVIRDFRPEFNKELTSPPVDGIGWFFPHGKDADSFLAHGLAPKMENPTEAWLVVREPVDKFRSACSMSRIGKGGRMSVDEKLTELESGEMGRDGHFHPQSRFVDLGIPLHLYRLEDIDKMAEDVGLSLPLPRVNASGTIVKFPKPDLTPKQEERVRKIYAEDIELYESMKQFSDTLNQHESGRI